MIIVFQILNQVFMINVGIQEASAAVIGNLIGAQDISQAKKYAHVIFWESLALGGLVSLMLYLSRHKVTALFTSDPKLTEIALSMYPFLCLCANIVDSMLMPF